MRGLRTEGFKFSRYNQLRYFCKKKIYEHLSHHFIIFLCKRGHPWGVSPTSTIVLHLLLLNVLCSVTCSNRASLVGGSRGVWIPVT